MKRGGGARKFWPEVEISGFFQLRVFPPISWTFEMPFRALVVSFESERIYVCENYWLGHEMKIHMNKSLTLWKCFLQISSNLPTHKVKIYFFVNSGRLSSTASCFSTSVSITNCNCPATSCLCSWICQPSCCFRITELLFHQIVWIEYNKRKSYKLKRFCINDSQIDCHIRLWAWDHFSWKQLNLFGESKCC